MRRFRAHQASQRRSISTTARVHGIGPRDSACHSGKKIREEFGGRASIRARRLEALLEKTAKERA
jgi:hypothetical protein